MSTIKTLNNFFFIPCLVLVFSSVAFAHSMHDHSRLPYKWEFSKDAKLKIARQIDLNTSNKIVGLSRFEQNKLSSYGIKIGNKFSSLLNGVDVLIERTTMGIRIISVDKFNQASSEVLIPIRKATNFSKISMISSNHNGHDHSSLNVEWTFGNKTNQKIVKRIFSSKRVALIGLNTFEQNLLNEYEISVGNRFYISISGHKFAAERTTSGLKVDNVSGSSNVAKTAKGFSLPADNV